MRFVPSPLRGVYTIELEPHRDQRGFLARAFCRQEFAEHGLAIGVEQANLSHNEGRGTVRGMHYQLPPSAEAKLVRCMRGAVFDVVVDLRPGSATYGEWFGADLTERNGVAMYVPELCAHGFQTLENNTLVYYQSTHPYTPSREAGLRHDDPAVGIVWPIDTQAISDKDASWPLLERRP